MGGRVIQADSEPYVIYESQSNKRPSRAGAGLLDRERSLSSGRSKSKQTNFSPWGSKRTGLVKVKRKKASLLRKRKDWRTRGFQENKVLCIPRINGHESVPSWSRRNH